MAATNNEVTLLHGIQNLVKRAREIIMVLDDMVPSFIGKPYRHPIDRTGDVHIWFSTADGLILARQ